MKIFKTVFLVMCLVFVFKVARAEEVKKIDVKEIKKTIYEDLTKNLSENIKNSLGLSIYLQGGYTYNFENDSNQTNTLRVFDSKANSFIVDLAQITFSKEATKENIGYKIKFSMGETAKFIHANGLGTTNEHFDLTEGYIDYIAPIGKGIKLRFGKFVTYHGAEVIEAIDNPNYSRSLLFNYAIPFTHTGLMIGYPISNTISANIHIVNGWDNVEDNNKSKTFGLNFGYTPNESYSFLFNLMYGPEQNSNTSNNRFLFDWVSTLKPLKNLTLILNVDYGVEEGIDPSSKDADWKGISAIVKYEFNDNYTIAIRGEYFKDTDGVRTGIAQEVKEITITPEIKLASGLILRPEYRHDWSTKKAFNLAKDGITPTGKSQDTIALGIMYRW